MLVKKPLILEKMDVALEKKPQTFLPISITFLTTPTTLVTTLTTFLTTFVTLRKKFVTLLKNPLAGRSPGVVKPSSIQVSKLVERILPSVYGLCLFSEPNIVVLFGGNNF